MRKAATQAALDRSLERLGGEAAAEASSPSAATAVEDEGGGGGAPTPASLPTADRNVFGEAVEVAPFAERVDVGWLVWRGTDPEADMEHRKYGIVVDAQGADSVVVARDRVRGGNKSHAGRQETWFEVWPIADLDEHNSHDPGTSKRVQAAKRLLLSIGETLLTGRWDEEDERRMVAAAVLTADVARAWRTA